MLQPPNTFEEFLKSQKLEDWPKSPLKEDTISLFLKLDPNYSANELSDYLYESVPLKHEMIADLEMKITESTSFLETYYFQIFDPGVKTQIGESNIASQIKRTREEETDIKKTQRKGSIKECTFPGFKNEKFTDLPGDLEGPQILHYVTKAQNFKARFLRIWKVWFFSEASVAILQDTFWWFFLERFKPNQEAQDHLFDRIADSFVALFWSVHHDVKDAFFKVYADCLSQAVYAVFFEAFPKSRMVFDEKFKEELINLIFQWVSGLRPVPSSWKKWNLDFTDLIEIIPKKESVNNRQVIGPVVRSQLDFNLDELIEDAREMCISRIPDEEMKDINSVMEAPAKAATESHSIGPGPRFCRVLFKLGGQSPLVLHYLKMHEVTNILTSTMTHKLQRTEISRLPSVAPTYQDVIKEAQTVRKNIQLDYNIFRDKNKKELSEMEQQRLQFSKQIERKKTLLPEIHSIRKLQ